mmetsp:Transcript_2261/g.15037  ORF Transcript_2261/g.15037 Transcript_2261/m.15037 type:complete len:300 (-) Transcript_2261:1696-2595(-)
MFAHQQRVFLSSNQFGGRSHLLLPRICVDGARDEPCDVLVRICIVVRRFVRVVKKRSRWSSSRGDVDATRRLDCKARRHGGTRACLWTSDGGRRRNQRPCDGRGRGSRPAARSHVGRVPRARCATQGCQGMHVHDDASGKASRSAIRSAGQEDHEPSRPKCTCTATAPGTRRNDGRNQQQLVEALRPVVQRTRRRRSEHCFQDIGILLERVRGWTRRSGHCRCSRRGPGRMAIRRHGSSVGWSDAAVALQRRALRADEGVGFQVPFLFVGSCRRTNARPGVLLQESAGLHPTLGPDVRA